VRGKTGGGGEGATIIPVKQSSARGGKTRASRGQTKKKRAVPVKKSFGNYGFHKGGHGLPECNKNKGNG